MTSPKNITIDDTLGDQLTGLRPVYSPSIAGVWKGANCSDCAVVPDKQQAFDGTWTSATYNRSLGLMSVDLQFTGTAIYVYFILANTIAPGITTLTQCNFTLDGHLVGNFQHTPSTSTAFQYNVLAYSNSTLRNVAHNLRIGTSGLDHDALVIFDYAMYTVDRTLSTNSAAPASTSAVNHSGGLISKRVPRGVIVAGVVGGLIVLGLLALSIICYCRRRRRRHTTPRSRDSNSYSSQNQMTEQDALHSESLVPSTSHGFDRSSLALDTFYQSSPDGPQSADPFITRTEVSSSAPPSATWYPDSVTYHPHTVLESLPNGELMMSAGSVRRRSIPSPPSDSLGLRPAVSIESPVQTDESVHQVRMQPQMQRAELEREMGRVQQEIHELQLGAMDSPSYVPSTTTAGQSRDDMDIADMREHIRVMQEQIEQLKEQQQSVLAQGLSDEPLPEYSDLSPSLSRNSTNRQHSEFS